MARLENGGSHLLASNVRRLRREQKGSDLSPSQLLQRPAIKIFKSDPVQDRVVSEGCGAADARETSSSSAQWSSPAAVSGSRLASFKVDRSEDRSCRNCGGKNRTSVLRPKAIYSTVMFLVLTHLLLLLSSQIQAVSANPAVPAVISTTGETNLRVLFTMYNIGSGGGVGVEC